MVIIVLSEAKPLCLLAFGTSKERVGKQWVELKVSIKKKKSSVKKCFFIFCENWILTGSAFFFATGRRTGLETLRNVNGKM